MKIAKNMIISLKEKTHPDLIIGIQTAFLS